MHIQGERVMKSLSGNIHTFGEALRRLRNDRGLTHRDLSERVGVGQELLRQWEANESVPSRVQLKRLYGTLSRLQSFEFLLPHESVSAAQPKPVARTRPTVQPALDEQPAARTFGDALRRARLAEDLDQDELGALVGVTGQAVSAWELDLANPVLANYEQLLEFFPSLATAPKPHAQDIEKPDGGKGVPRDAMPTTSSPPTLAIPASDNLVSLPRPPHQGPESRPAATPPAPTVASRAPEPPTELGPGAAPSLPAPAPTTVEQAGAEYAQSRLALRRAELLLEDLLQQLADAEAQVEQAKTRVQAADQSLRNAVAEAATQHQFS